jgi:hypothetical protein
VDDDDEATGMIANSAASVHPTISCIQMYRRLLRGLKCFEGIRGAAGTGSTYDGSTFLMSASLELSEPACLRIILVLSLSTPGDCAEWERDISLGERRKEDGEPGKQTGYVMAWGRRVAGVPLTEVQSPPRTARCFTMSSIFQLSPHRAPVTIAACAGRHPS